VPVGSYDLFVAGPDRGYGAHASLLGPEPFFARTRVNVSGGNVDGIDLAVSAGRAVTIRLTSASGGEPPAGCPLNATVSAELLEPWAIVGLANARVAFGKEQTLRNLPPARVRLSASGLGSGCYQPDAPVIDLSGDPASPVPLEIASSGSIHGILLPGTARASDFTVVLLDFNAAASTQARVASPDSEGRFTFDGLPPGRYRVAAQPVATSSRSRWVTDLSSMKEIQVPGGKPTDLELSAVPKGGRQ